MSSITAAIGISQIKKLDKLIKKRRNNAQFISKNLKKFDQIITPNEPKSSKHVYQLYSIQLPNTIIRNKLMKYLENKGIMSKVYFFPIHLTTFYKKLGYSTLSLDITKKISDKILSLPMFPGMTKEELCYIVESVSQFMEQNKKF